MSYKDEEEESIVVDIGDEEEVEIGDLISDDDIDSPLEEELLENELVDDEEVEEFAGLDGSEY